MNRVAREVSVKIIRVELAYAREAVLNHPIVPTIKDFTMTSLRSSSPDSIDNHGAESRDVTDNGWFSAEKVFEVISKWSPVSEMCFPVSAPKVNDPVPIPAVRLCCCVIAITLLCVYL